ncbi:class I SAM-dependent methyltransferase [Candidatus Woesearchaeota archaeon]|nr:class I SAM-dependent methyltransferase [Candidatus Woesearchaeota archaeon]
MANCIICDKDISMYLFEKNGYQVVKCLGDGHLYVANPPDIAALSDLYSKEYFEGTAKVGYRSNVFLNKQKQAQKASRKLARLQQLNNIRQVLDVGCGPGYFVKAAGDAGLDVSGCDISQAAADFAKDELSVDVVVGDFLEFEHTRFFDAITMFSYLEHTIDPRAHLDKAYKLLRHDGLLLLSVPNTEGLVRGIMGPRWRGFSVPEHLHFFNQQNLSKLVRDAGFSDLRSRYVDNNFLRDTVYFYARKKSF